MGMLWSGWKKYVFIGITAACGLALLVAYYQYRSDQTRFFEYAFSLSDDDKKGLSAFIGPYWGPHRKPTYDQRTPVDHLDFPQGVIPNKGDYHALFIATLEVKKGGDAVVRAISDDGVQAWINDQLVIQDMQRHPPRETRGEMRLEAGRHLFVLYYYQAKLDATLEVDIDLPPGASYQFHPMTPKFDLAEFRMLHQKIDQSFSWLKTAQTLFLLSLLVPLMAYLAILVFRQFSENWHNPAFTGEFKAFYAPWKGDNLPAFLIFTLLALFFTYPLVHDMASSFPCDFGWSKQPESHRNSDTFQFVWNIWWYKQAFLNGQNPIFTTQIYHPFGTTLAYHTTTPAFSTPGALLNLFMDLIPAYNLTLLLTLILTGYNLYFLMRYLGVGFAAALIAGCVYAFNPYHMGKGMNTMNQFSVQWVPLFIWIVLRAFRKPEAWRLWVGMGLLLALNYYTGNYTFLYCALFGLPMVLMGPFTLGVPRLNRATFMGLGLAAMVAALAAAPLVYQVLLAKFSSGGVVPLKGAPPMSWKQLFTRPLLHPWFSFEAAFEATQNLRFYWYNYLGVPLLTASVLSLLNKKRLRLVAFFGFAGLIFTSLTLNPEKIWTTILRQVPMLSDFRGFDNFIIMMMFCAAALSGFFVEYLLKLRGSKVVRRAGVALSLVFAGVLVFEFWTIPYPLFKYRPPPEVQAMMDDPHPGAVLELPLMVKKPWVGPNRLMLYQTSHERPRFVSTLSRIPKRLFDPYRKKYPNLDRLREGKDLDPMGLRRELDELEVRYVVVERPYYRGEQWLAEMVESTLPWQIIGENQDFIYYKRMTPPHAPEGNS
jgi:hypothetical protein